MLPYELEHGDVYAVCVAKQWATLKGRTIFYNKKKIRISNSKVTNTKHIRFYYVLSAGKPSPTVPSDQGFYQSLWDSLWEYPLLANDGYG
jgi:hypothetical protein